MYSKEQTIKQTRAKKKVKMTIISQKNLKKTRTREMEFKPISVVRMTNVMNLLR